MKKANKSLRPGDTAQTIGAESEEVSNAIDKLKKEGKIKSSKKKPISKRRFNCLFSDILSLSINFHSEPSNYG
jgi:hypothetical protein